MNTVVPSSLRPPNTFFLPKTCLLELIRVHDDMIIFRGGISRIFTYLSSTIRTMDLILMITWWSAAILKSIWNEVSCSEYPSPCNFDCLGYLNVKKWRWSQSFLGVVLFLFFLERLLSVRIRAISLVLGDSCLDRGLSLWFLLSM